MNSAEPLIYYPQYCFHLSPTINKWCPLRAVDIQRLGTRRGFEGQDVFFCSNHPVRWVRVVGVIVAVDEYSGRRIYTIDDSTGHCVECTIVLPKPAANNPRNANANATRHHNGFAQDPTHEADAAAPEIPSLPPGIDVGMVVDVKGSLTLFRDEKQIKIIKIQHVRSSEQEVQFWDKILHFRRDVISNPWVVDDKVERRCRKQHLVDSRAEEMESKRRHKHQQHVHRQKPIQRESHRQSTKTQAKDLAPSASRKVSNGSKKDDAKGNVGSSKQKTGYNALGL